MFERVDVSITGVCLCVCLCVIFQLQVSGDSSRRVWKVEITTSRC